MLVQINEFMSNQAINQINKKPTKHMNLKITALPKKIQIDMVSIPLVIVSKNNY
jgi:hypothetical protein